MCGRYTISHSTEEILERFHALADLFTTDTAQIASASHSNTTASDAQAESPLPAMSDNRVEVGAVKVDGSTPAKSSGHIVLAVAEPQEAEFTGSEDSEAAVKQEGARTHTPNYNVAPTQFVPVILLDPDDEQRTRRVLQICKWGLVPFWAKHAKQVTPIINARSEGVTSKPVFKSAFAKRRCIIPADGFYEWKKAGSRKTPMRMRFPDDRIFGMAGIYQDWTAPDGSLIRTVAIITVPANDMMKEIHDRMPAILLPECESDWLNSSEISTEDVYGRYLLPYPGTDLEAYAVSNLVNKAKMNGPQLILPAEMCSDDAAAQPERSVAAPESERKVSTTRRKRRSPEVDAQESRKEEQLKLPLGS